MQIISKKLEGLSIESGLDLQRVLRVNKCTSQAGAFQKLEEMIPVFRSRMGALLFLISALLSRGLVRLFVDNMQSVPSTYFIFNMGNTLLCCLQIWAAWQLKFFMP